MHQHNLRKTLIAVCFALVLGVVGSTISRNQDAPSLVIDFKGLVLREDKRPVAILVLSNKGPNVLYYEGFSTFPSLIYQMRQESGELSELGPMLTWCMGGTPVVQLEPGQTQYVEVVFSERIHRYALNYTEARFGGQLLEKLPYSIRKHLPQSPEHRALSQVISIDGLRSDR